MRPNPIVLSDFDGTVTDLDTGVVLLERFAVGDWRELERRYENEELEVEAVLREQFSMVRSDKESMLAAVDDAVSVRPGFAETVSACRARGVRVVVVSYGLRFCIDHVLRRAGLAQSIEVLAPRARVLSDRIALTFQKRRVTGSVNLKDEAVLHFRSLGHQVLYVGDGASDLPAVRVADYPFVVRGSVLDILCASRAVKCERISDFGPVRSALRRLSSG